VGSPSCRGVLRRRGWPWWQSDGDWCHGRHVDGVALNVTAGDGEVAPGGDISPWIPIGARDRHARRLRYLYTLSVDSDGAPAVSGHRAIELRLHLGEVYHQGVVADIKLAAVLDEVSAGGRRPAEVDVLLSENRPLVLLDFGGRALGAHDDGDAVPDRLIWLPAAGPQRGPGGGDVWCEGELPRRSVVGPDRPAVGADGGDGPLNVACGWDGPDSRRDGGLTAPDEEIHTVRRRQAINQDFDSHCSRPQPL